ECNCIITSGKMENAVVAMVGWCRGRGSVGQAEFLGLDCASRVVGELWTRLPSRSWNKTEKPSERLYIMLLRIPQEFLLGRFRLTQSITLLCRHVVSSVRVLGRSSKKL